MCVCVCVCVCYVVKSWDGGVNSVDSTGLPGERKGKERDRDSWDQELDKGKVKILILWVSGLVLHLSPCLKGETC